MKKLYAKTSFSSKNRSNKSQHKADNETLSKSSASQAEIYKYHDPILAYQPSTQTSTPKGKMKDTNMKYTPKHPFVSKFHNLDTYRTSNELANTEDDESNMNSSMYNDESPYYYTITELENLHMLDHRHPQFHHHIQRMQQLQHMPHNANDIKIQYHQHNQLVLQLPPASSLLTSNDNNNNDGDDDVDIVDGLPYQQQQKSLISPIYEAPQMKYNYNQHNTSATLKSSSATITTTPPPPPPPQHYNSTNTHCATTRTLSASSSSLSASMPLDVYNRNCNNHDQNQPQLLLSMMSPSPSSSISLSSISTSTSSSSMSAANRDNLSSKTDFMTTTSSSNNISNSTTSTTISPTSFAYVFL